MAERFKRLVASWFNCTHKYKRTTIPDFRSEESRFESDANGMQSGTKNEVFFGKQVRYTRKLLAVAL